MKPVNEVELILTLDATFAKKAERIIEPKQNEQVKKEARGRGNQGDHALPQYTGTGELSEHAEHNRAVEAKKAVRKQRREK